MICQTRNPTHNSGDTHEHDDVQISIAPEPKTWDNAREPAVFSLSTAGNQCPLDDDIRQWLREIGFQSMEASFQKAGLYTFQIIKGYPDEQLKKMFAEHHGNQDQGTEAYSDFDPFREGCFEELKDQLDAFEDRKISWANALFARHSVEILVTKAASLLLLVLLFLSVAGFAVYEINKCVHVLEEYIPLKVHSCLKKCGWLQGPCAYCGVSGMCCRYGSHDTSGGCDGTFGIPGLPLHFCVQNTSKSNISFAYEFRDDEVGYIWTDPHFRVYTTQLVCAALVLCAIFPIIWHLGRRVYGIKKRYPKFVAKNLVFWLRIGLCFYLLRGTVLILQCFVHRGEVEKWEACPGGRLTYFSFDCLTLCAIVVLLSVLVMRKQYFVVSSLLMAALLLICSAPLSTIGFGSTSKDQDSAKGYPTGIRSFVLFLLESVMLLSLMLLLFIRYLDTKKTERKAT